jgi:hypothetical protein
MEKPTQPASTNKDKPLKEINFHVNEFGQIVRDVKLEEINAFLDENVPDKKLEESDDEIAVAD